MPTTPTYPDNQITKYGAKPYHHKTKMDCTIIAVKHNEYTKYVTQDIKDIMPDKAIIIDVRGAYKDNKEITNLGYYWKL